MAHLDDENGGEVWEYEAGYPEKAAVVEQRFEEAKPPQAFQESVEASTGQGTITGVFIPCVQSIIGIILFSRFAWVTGEAGVAVTVLVLVTCTAVTILTTLSMSAIATNGKIPTGGSYYMIARSLGPAFGGSVGLLYYLGLTSSAGIYLVGSVEIFLTNTSYGIVGENFDIRLLGLIGVFFIWVINFVGMKYVTKTSIGILAVLVLTLLSIYVGFFTAGSRSEVLPKGVSGLGGGNFEDNFGEGYSHGTGLSSVIAIFFPAFTGIMPGCDRSGFLKTPAISIPKGTLSAITLTSLLYLSFVLLFGLVAERETLQTVIGLSALLAWPSADVVTVGIIATTFGAALQCLASAPQILFSMAQDDILPLGSLKSDVQKPLLVSALIICSFVTIGNFDSIAPLVTMFHLMFYGCVNVACCVLSVLNNPSWRPLWPYYHWTTALAGSVLCFTLMVVISWWAALISFSFAAALY